MQHKSLLKIILLFFLIFFLIVILIYPLFKNNNQHFQKKQGQKNVQKKIQNYERKTIKEETSIVKSIFIPSWVIINEKINGKIKDFCPLIYFGQKDKIDDFLLTIRNNLECRELYFTLKVEEIKEQQKWLHELEDLTQFLKEKQFKGWILNLEISGLLSLESKEEINQMVEIFYQKGVKEGFKTYLTVYGDLFYRKRGYDLPFFVKNSDGIMVMAYDFSKSYGQPGPNFPFSGKEKYGYDFQTMIGDFLQIVPKEKLIIIFGMFGYDWQVDEKQRPFSQAKSLTLNQIREKFLSSSRQHLNNGRVKNDAKEFNCAIDNCVITRDQLAKEVEINYTITSDQPDENGVYRIDYHVVWFEDEESVKIKTDYLKEKGINRISFWAMSYF